MYRIAEALTGLETVSLLIQHPRWECFISKLSFNSIKYIAFYSVGKTDTEKWNNKNEELDYKPTIHYKKQEA